MCTGRAVGGGFCRQRQERALSGGAASSFARYCGSRSKVACVVQADRCSPSACGATDGAWLSELGECAALEERSDASFRPAGIAHAFADRSEFSRREFSGNARPGRRTVRPISRRSCGAAYTSYGLRLEDPDGKTKILRAVSYSEAQKTVVVEFTPAKPGAYKIVVLGFREQLSDPTQAPVLATMRFEVEVEH